MKDKQYLHDWYNATSTGKNDELETYENWLERQLLARIERIKELMEEMGKIWEPLKVIADSSIRKIEELEQNNKELKERIRKLKMINNEQDIEITHLIIKYCREIEKLEGKANGG